MEAEGLYDRKGSPDSVHSQCLRTLVLFLCENACTTSLKTGHDDGEIGFRAFYFDYMGPMSARLVLMLSAR
jgi:hypothetical protein